MPAPLDHPVLVLNRYWQPIQTCSVRRALKLLCLGHAQVVQTEGEACFQTHDFSSWVVFSEDAWVEEEERIHSINLAIRRPKVVVLALYERLPRPEVRFTRRNVFLRDCFTCQYCAKRFPEQSLNLDHVLPRNKGGKTSWTNIVTSCVPCNTRKANKLTHEANMHPLHEPVAPRWRPMFGLAEGGKADPSWNQFLREEDAKDLLKSA